MSEDVAHPERDESWDSAERHETETERLDRNWGDLLQEIRVIQTGVQLLTGFLLTLPFQQRFTRLDETERAIYLATVVASILATIFLQAPISVHRGLFRRHERRATVLTAHRLAVVGLAFLALAVIGVTLIVFAVLHGLAAAAIAGAVAAVLITALWLVLPLALRDD
jgi:O-antigen/teichoic acid export membrane protein